LNGDISDARLCNLAYGSRSDNARDMKVHGTQPLGEEIWNAKLTKSAVRAIRRLYLDGLSQYEIAARFSISQSNVSLIVTGQCWSHVPREFLALRPAKKTDQKLDPDKVRQIRRRYADGETQTAIARDYGVRSTTISELIRGNIWAHVSDDMAEANEQRGSAK
jgi:DNA invertase Pin-like site-specific DNA recombinase